MMAGPLPIDPKCAAGQFDIDAGCGLLPASCDRRSGAGARATRPGLPTPALEHTQQEPIRTRYLHEPDIRTPRECLVPFELGTDSFDRSMRHVIHGYYNMRIAHGHRAEAYLPPGRAQDI